MPLSKQQILDCSYKGVKDSTGKSYRNQGCTGGNLKYAYDYMSINGNMEEEAYPYAKYVKIEFFELFVSIYISLLV